MNTTMKPRMGAVFAAALTIAALAGCGAGGAGGTGASGTNTPAAEPKIDLAKIEYTVESVPIDGERELAMSYTNGSGATIVAMEMQYRQKDETTDEQRDAAFARLRSGLEWSDEDYADNKDSVLRCENSLIVEDGASVDNTGCSVGGWKARGDFMEIMEPDIMTVAYLKGDGKIGTATYDCINAKTTIGKEEKDADNWGDDALTAMLPKPESQVITDSYISDDRVSYYAYGITQDQFDAYIDACREQGFTDDSMSDSSVYMDGADGSRLDMYYDVDNQSLRVGLDAPDDADNTEE